MVEKLYSKNKIFIIKYKFLYNGVKDYYCEVQPKNRLQYIKELYSDFVGDTATHPIFLGYSTTNINSLKRHIKISINLDNERRS